MSKERSIEIRMDGPAVIGGRVSVSLFSRTISSFQQVFYQLGGSRKQSKPSSGRYPDLVSRECELFLTAFRPDNSYTALLELPPQELIPLFPEEPDFGERVLNDFHEITQAIEQRAPERIAQIVPDRVYQHRIMGSLVPILPSKDDDYSLRVRAGAAESFALTRPTEVAFAELTGPFIETAEKPEEAIIEGKCIVKVDKRGNIKNVIQWLNYELFKETDLRPYRTREISSDGTRLKLKSEIASNVAKEGNLIVIEYEPLGIRAYAASRSEAIADFNEEFVFLWQEYGSASTESLAPDARQLRENLLALVEGTDIK